MNLMGNIIWLLCGGLFSGISWYVSGVLWCFSIVGIPYGRQCFKFGKLSFTPFGKNISYENMGSISFLTNIIWIVFFGIPMALENALYGAILCITIIGIPFGLQFFKLARLSLMPFGAKIVS